MLVSGVADRAICRESFDFRCGSCVTSIAGPNGAAQLYER